MTEFSGRVALVTGGAGGIGRATVEAFRQAGAMVAFCDVDAARGAALADELSAGLGGPDAPVLFVPADVGDRPAVEVFVAAAARRFGRIDVLVNNAGITHDRTDFGALDFAVWTRVLDVNLNGAFFAIQAALPHMVRQGGGAIVNVGSILAHALFPGKTAYATSKAAVEGFTKALALDLADRNIRVNCLVPGSVDTDMMWRGIDPAAKEEAARESGADVPLRRVAGPQELAAAALFLAGDGASYVTGTSLLVDGGMLARIAARR
jgi:NAD(P)-dependent dehydrogenase (short-subunit alcohol dehydrogenase family)